MTDIIIRPIEEHDIEAFHYALDIVSREKKYLAFTEAPPLESTRKFIMGNIAKDIAQFVACNQDKIVGWCDISETDRPVLAHTGTLGMGIIPEYRGCGLGRKLMHATINKSQARGLTRIELDVRSDNDRAIALYKKIGFDIEGLKRKKIFIDGVYYDSYIMSLLFIS